MRRTAISLPIACLGVVLTFTIASATETTAIRVDFESDTVGPYTREMVKHDWGQVVWTNLHDRAHIVLEEQAPPNRALRIAYPAGAVGPSQGGGQFIISLAPSEELWFSYRVKFGQGFDYALGGKLPGLSSGGDKYTGGHKPKDGDGWSARYMWGKNGKIVVYLYYVDMPGHWGEDLSLGGVKCVPGRWHQLTQHIRVNTPGQANGVLDVWFDGKKALARSNIRFRIGEKGLIDSVDFETFHGGSTKEWAPTVDSFSFLDDFIVAAGPPDSLLDRGPNQAPAGTARTLPAPQH